MSDLKYSDIKQEKPLVISENKVQKMTRFHELTRALSPKRKSTKLLLIEARKSVIKLRERNANLKQTQNIFEKTSEESVLNISKTIRKNFDEKNTLSKRSDNELENKMKFMKYRKVLINSQNKKSDNMADCGVLLAKELRSQDVNFSSVSKIANMKEESEQNKEKNEFFNVQKIIDTPIVNEIHKIEDMKESFARIHVHF